MFKINFITLVIILTLATNVNSYAHKEWVHQHLIKEGYKLLYKEFGNIPELAKVCGFDNYGNETFTYERNISEKNIDVNIPLLTRAVWIEDTDDILFEYDDCDRSTSGAHFWNADQGDEETTYLHGIYNAEGQNAWSKVRKYFGNSTSNEDVRLDPYEYSQRSYTRLFGKNHFVGNVRMNNITVNMFLDTPNQSIFDFMNHGNFRNITDWDIKGMQGLWSFTAPNFTNVESYPQWTGFTNREVYGISILGRIAHLLGDMSVPAHVKNDLHPCFERFDITPCIIDILPDIPTHFLKDGDSHELHCGHGVYTEFDNAELPWDREYCNEIPTNFNNEDFPNQVSFKVREEYNNQTSREQGSLIWEAFENYEHNKFLRYLFYSLNQISDVYPSVSLDEPTAKEHGNKNTPNTIDGNSPLLQLTYDKIPNSVMSSDYNFNDQSDVLYNMAIRFTATYLYWVAKNLNWLSDEQNLFCQNRPKDMTTFTNIKNHEFLGKYFKNENRGNSTEFHTSNIMRIGKLESITDIPDGDVIIDPSARVDLSSKAEIHFKPGFHAKRGSDMVASINNNTCPTTTITNVGVQSPKSSDNLPVNFSKFEQSIFTAFPNPTSNSINCSYNNLGEEEKITISIFDQYSKLIKEITENAQKGNNLFTFDLSQFSNGVYFVVLDNIKNTYSNKISVIK